MKKIKVNHKSVKDFNQTKINFRGYDNIAKTEKENIVTKQANILELNPRKDIYEKILSRIME